MTITYYYPHKDKVKIVVHNKYHEQLLNKKRVTQTVLAPKYYFMYNLEIGFKIVHHKAFTKLYKNNCFIDVRDIDKFLTDCEHHNIKGFRDPYEPVIYTPEEIYLQLANMCWDFTEIPYYLSSYTPL